MLTITQNGDTCNTHIGFRNKENLPSVTSNLEV